MQDNHPCAFASKKFLPAEQNYTTEERELLAIIQALKLFRCYLEGNHFTIVTDHHPLRYFDTKTDLSPRQARWAQYLSRFDYEWRWIKGTTNPADFLSRHPTLAALTRSQTSGQQPPPPDRFTFSRSVDNGVSTSRNVSSRKRKLSSLQGDSQVPEKSFQDEETAPSNVVYSDDQRLDLDLIKLGYQKSSWQQWIAKPANANLLFFKK